MGGVREKADHRSIRGVFRCTSGASTIVVMEILRGRVLGPIDEMLRSKNLILAGLLFGVESETRGTVAVGIDMGLEPRIKLVLPSSSSNVTGSIERREAVMFSINSIAPI